MAYKIAHAVIHAGNGSNEVDCVWASGGQGRTTGRALQEKKHDRTTPSPDALEPWAEFLEYNFSPVSRSSAHARPSYIALATKSE